MVRIISRGSPPWTDIRTCSDCKSILEISEEDLKIGHFGEDLHKAPFARCPVCNSCVKFSFDDVPFYIGKK
jgi:hypothetical protein